MTPWLTENLQTQRFLSADSSLAAILGAAGLLCHEEPGISLFAGIAQSIFTKSWEVNITNTWCLQHFNGTCNYFTSLWRVTQHPEWLC